MSESETPTPDTTGNSGTNAKSCNREGGRHGRHGRRGGLRKLFVLALVLGGLGSIPFAVAQAAGPFGHGGCEGAPESAEALRQRVDRGAGFLLGKLDATDEQEARIDTILDRVVPELFALKDDHAALREEARAALTGDTVDAAEIEGIRKEALGLADDASRIVVNGVVEIAQVLTPEQRAEAGALAERFHGRK